jgi:phospholipid/cholesterol/gamma-HCH transport system permease protein
MTSVTRPISDFGWSILMGVVAVGHFTIFAGDAMRAFAMRIPKWMRWHLLGPQMYNVGVSSIPVVAITGAFIGMVLALESFDQFESIGQETRLGGIISISVTRQIGPVLAAVMVAGRVGGALAAELGTMRVTEQLDAMRAMGADPMPYLVVPRVVACVLMTPFLTVYSDLLGVWGGWLITVQFYDVPNWAYWDFTRDFVNWWEPVSGLIKSVFFGVAIGLVACYKGFNCQAGASGVGRAATESFVVSFLAIIALNFVLAKVLNTIGDLFIYDSMNNAFG